MSISNAQLEQYIKNCTAAIKLLSNRIDSMSSSAASIGDAKLNEFVQRLRNDVADLENKVSKLQQDGDN